MTDRTRLRTLVLCAVLHAFTHIYHVALMPLYLPIQADLKLRSVEQATLLLTVMMLAYFLPSYFMGLLADRFDRGKVLAAGLAINALGFTGLAFAPNYGWALVCVAVSGFGGSFFHPAATALTVKLFPKAPGRALGWIGVGASFGFFFSPIYSGWRAETAGWRAPVLELGLLGLLMAALFRWLARDVRPEAPAAASRHHKPGHLFPAPVIWGMFLASAFFFGLRDFTGSSMGSLGSLFLQKAHGFTLKETGLALGSIFLASAISNPLFGHLSDRGRFRWTLLVLIAAAVLVAVFPHLPGSSLVPALAVYGFFFMASYPMVEAALMESVPDSVRGRVFGLFITLGGLTGNLSHWAVGAWVRHLGEGAAHAPGYFGIYTGLAILLLISLAGLPCLYAVRRRELNLLAAAKGPAPMANPQFE